MMYVSFVVDANPRFYYEAELLLHSLLENGGFLKEEIVVQCTNRVEDIFLKFLKKNQYTYNIIEPYLDGKYCNKLKQLEYFYTKKEFAGVLLLDTDMYICSNIKDISQNNAIVAKIVDGPNPSIETLKNIYQTAKLDYPQIVSPDWYEENQKTFINNFNGGFYYIPQNYIENFSKQWQFYATWLFEHKELFLHKHQIIHIDQVSFSLALHNLGYKYKSLSANYNYPLHVEKKIQSYEEHKPIKILHYHRELNRFGILNEHKCSAAKKANKQIIAKEKDFIALFKKSLINISLNTNHDLVLKIENLIKKYGYMKIIFHGGTPKTATTSLQSYLNTNSDVIVKEHGIYYPKVNLDVPKHQWIVSALLNENYEEFYTQLEKVYANAKEHNAKTIILSTEGIYNHWMDFSSQAKTVFTIFAKYFSAELWLIFREPLSFLESFYKQNLKNPPSKLVQCYGSEMSFEEMLCDDWFIRHLDYLGHLYEYELIFTQKNIKLFKYSPSIVQELIYALIGEKNDGKNSVMVEIKNKKLSNEALVLLKATNKYYLLPQDKKQLVNLLEEIDAVLSKYKVDNRVTIDSAEKEIVDNLFANQKNLLSGEYGIEFE